MHRLIIINPPVLALWPTVAFVIDIHLYLYQTLVGCRISLAYRLETHNLSYTVTSVTTAIICLIVRVTQWAMTLMLTMNVKTEPTIIIFFFPPLTFPISFIQTRQPHPHQCWQKREKLHYLMSVLQWRSLLSNFTFHVRESARVHWDQYDVDFIINRRGLNA